MNQKITIGQYIPGNSWLHKLDPRFKIFSLVLLLISTFLIPIPKETNTLIYIYMIGGLLLFSLILTISAKIPLGRVISGIRPVIVLLTFTFLLQLFTIKNGKPLHDIITLHISLTSILAIVGIIIIYNITKRYIPLRTLYFFIVVFLSFYVQYLLPYIPFTTYQLQITDYGLIRGIFLFLRIITIIILTSLLTFTTMTTDLNYGIESLLKPLKVVKFPVEMMSMMLALILRYIPTLLFETDKIMQAQASRGLDFKESKFKDKLIQVIALLIPIFVISLNRASELSDAMEARGYVIGAPRSRIDEFKMNYKDIIAVIVSILILTTIIVVKVKI